MLSGVDGDVFGKVSKLGRAAADAVARALAGEPWDPFHASRCMDALLTTARGIPTLIVVERELNALQSSPLLASLGIQDALDRVRAATLVEGCTELDILLRGAVESSVKRRDFEFRSVVERFCALMLDRCILTGRGGFMEQRGHAQLGEARALLAPTGSATAATLCARPDARRLGLARSHAKLGPQSDLLGEP
jgi:hypothetical protein